MFRKYGSMRSDFASYEFRYKLHQHSFCSIPNQPLRSVISTPWHQGKSLPLHPTKRNPPQPPAALTCQTLRFNARDPSRTNLFSAYDSQQQQPRAQSRSPAFQNSSSTSKPHTGGYGYSAPSSNLAFSAYPGGGGGQGAASSEPSFRTATPNQRGQYSDAVLSELESQNDEQLEGMSAKVRMLKDVRLVPLSPPHGTLRGECLS